MALASLVVLVLVGSAHSSAVQSGTTANQRAKAWLRAHGEADPDAAGMQDLKNSDPNAFAIVQALLTKRSLGLLDPSNPSANFGGAKRPQQRSFKQEAEDAGVSMESSSSGSTANSNLPYPSAQTGSSVALPFPDVGAEHDDSHFGFHAHTDDEAMVNSVLGAVDELKTHGSALATKKSTTRPNSLTVENSPISLDWGNPHAGVDQPAAPTHQSLVVSQATSTASDGSQMAMAAQMNADASALGEELVVQQENAQNSVASANHHAPIVPPSLDWANPHAGSDMQPSQMSMGQQNSYLAATPVTADRSQDPVEAMERSSFHKLAESFKHFSAASNRVQVRPAASQDLGANYQKDLQAAKNDQWKFALQSTQWGKESAPAQAIAQVQEAFDDDDGLDPTEEENLRQQKIQKFLGAPKHYARYAPKAAMTQEGEVDDSDGGAKFEAWIGSKSAKSLETSYDKVMPQNQYLNDYMKDLTH